MSLKIPTTDYLKGHNKTSRKFVTQMASNGFLPVIALEACVEAGRTYQAYQRGGFDEARERITEEFMGAVFWLGGVTGLNWVFEKIGQAILKLPNKNVDIADDEVHTPFKNYLQGEKTKKGLEISEKTMTRFKFIKVLSSVLIANAFIGFILPKINQAITRNRHKKAAERNDIQKDNFEYNSFIPRKTFAQFNNEDSQNRPNFSGLSLLTIASNLENKRNWKLLSVDVGTSTGRVVSARNNDERVEIGFRDISSIFFYMFNMPLVNSLLNKLEHGKSTRLDPMSAEFASQYLQSYIDEIKESTGTKSVDADKFAKDILGEEVELSPAMKAKLSTGKIKTMSVDEFIEILRADETYASRLTELEQLAQRMSQLQPKRQGVSILTESQTKDILGGGHINNPEFLKEFYKTRFKDKFLNKYLFVSQRDIDAHKEELIDYIKSIINKSTIIPKLQYKITQWRTGSNEFPGTAQYRDEENKK